MHKFCILALVVTAAVVASGAKVRMFRPGASRSMSYPRRAHAPLGPGFHYPAMAPMMDGFDISYSDNYIQPMPMLHYPMASQMQPMARMGRRFGGRLPDGEYRTAHGIATVDGSDVSMDSHW